MSLFENVGPLGMTAIAGGVVIFGLASLPYEASVGSAEVAIEPGPAPAASVAAPVSAAQAEATTRVAEPTQRPIQSDAPRFDVVRVDKEGSALIAGVAMPGDEVSLMLDGEEISRVTGARDGSFVAMLDITPSQAPRVLTLSASAPSQGSAPARLSKGSVIVAPSRGVAAAAAVGPEKQETVLAPVVQDTGAGVAVQGKKLSQDNGAVSRAAVSVQLPRQVIEGGSQAEGPALAVRQTDPALPAQTQDGRAQAQVPNAQAVATGPEADGQASEASAPAILLASAEGVQVLQPAASGNRRAASVVIDAISYDAVGDVVLSGRGGPEGGAGGPAQARIYLNNAPIQSATIGADGGWTLALQGVAEGVYTLRVDQVDGTGQVTSRFETPFKREAVAVAALVAPTSQVAQAVSISVVTVQPGYTLWGIAAENYGDGVKFVQVFDANQDKIADPDLIYPGQVFDLPVEGLLGTE